MGLIQSGYSQVNEYDRSDVDRGLRNSLSTIADNYDKYAKNNYDRLQAGYDKIGDLANHVSARDSEEALKQITASRNELAETFKKYGSGSIAFQHKQAEILARLAAFKQQSSGFIDNYSAGVAAAEKNPYAVKPEVYRMLTEESKKPVGERDQNLALKFQSDPAAWNMPAYIHDMINNYSKGAGASQSWTTDHADYVQNHKLDYNSKLHNVSLDPESGKYVYSKNASEDLVKSIYDTNPALMANWIDSLPNVDTAKLSELGYGETADQKRLAILEHYINSTSPDASYGAVGQPKIKPNQYTPAAQTRTDRDHSIARVREALDSGNTDFLSSLYGAPVRKVGDDYEVMKEVFPAKHSEKKLYEKISEDGKDRYYKIEKIPRNSDAGAIWDHTGSSPLGKATAVKKAAQPQEGEEKQFKEGKAVFKNGKWVLKK